MNIQLTNRIKQNARSFSKGQRLIAKYIEEHYDKVAFMTASKLGATVGVSESTVVRFATEIGYSGYPALQQAMQEMIRNRMTSVQRLEMTSTNIPLDRLLDSSMDQDIDIIRRTKESISHEEFYRAADALVKVKKVYIIGAGSSLAIATFLSHYFSLVFDSVQLISATSEAQILQQMVHIGEGDALIGISFPRYSKKAVKALKYASDRGATVVAITDSTLSPLTKYAEHVLLAKSDMVSFVDSLVGPLALINALIVTVAIKKKDEVGEYLLNLRDHLGRVRREKIEEQDRRRRNVDTIVVGGAAGADGGDHGGGARQARLIIEEKERLAWRKIRITGKGRCNMANNCEPRDQLNPRRQQPVLYRAVATPRRTRWTFLRGLACR